MQRGMIVEDEVRGIETALGGPSWPPVPMLGQRLQLVVETPTIMKTLHFTAIHDAMVEREPARRGSAILEYGEPFRSETTPIFCTSRAPEHWA